MGGVVGGEVAIDRGGGRVAELRVSGVVRLGSAGVGGGENGRR